ncbi:DUF456 domain-containing protein [Aquimarina brevivitae]|uniref:DUF456 domain-containing protein n=1 Tax=Aquimarina brevivitae TaxID=323412 RepID=A0A4V2F7G5_9FLAO|nr:DUF456 domain-containing protein [Aquimarina brevivitae]RZS99739.1 hypothetical protein EV197_0964 [Aquimarina brevivitae]
MDIVLIVVGFLFCLLGIVGSFLPILPGPLTAWIGFLVLHLTKAVPMNWTFLGITLAVAIIVWVLDYVVPAMGTKRFGGTKYGAIGATLGLIVGIIAPIPLGIIIGPFVGAFIGEMLKVPDSGKALKAAFGSFLGFLAGTFIKFIVSLAFLVLYIMEVSSHWDRLF